MTEQQTEAIKEAADRLTALLQEHPRVEFRVAYENAWRGRTAPCGTWVAHVERRVVVEIKNMVIA